MSAHDLRKELFLTPEETAKLFRHEGDLKWVWRHSAEGKFLHAAKRHFGREVLFSAAELERITATGEKRDKAPWSEEKKARIRALRAEKKALDSAAVELHNSTERRHAP
jgi:hypothetical protein